MPVFRYREEIPRSPEAVFDFMMDFRHAPYWRSLVSRMEVVGGGEARAGSEICVTFDVQGRQREILTHVTDVDRPRRFAFWNENDGMRGEFSYDIEGTAAGSLVTFTCRAKPLKLSLWLVLPWIYKQSRARYAGQLASLRTAMDQRLPVS